LSWAGSLTTDAGFRFLSSESRPNIFEVMSMAPRFRFMGWVGMAAVAAVLTVELASLYAQTLNEGWKGLEPLFITAKRPFGDLRNGRTKVETDNKSHIETIDVMARYHTYGPYLRNLDTQPGQLDKAYQDFAADVDAVFKAKDRESVQGYAEVFRDRVRLRAMDVLQFDRARPIYKIYNARILAKVADLGQGALAETLLTLLKDAKQNDAVRYYVLRGLSKLLAQVQPMQMPPLLTKDEEAKCAEAIVAFLDGKKGPDKKAPQEEIDGFCILRREAIRALAQIHTPAFSNKNRPALVLARFAGNDERLQPPPRIDERVEAAVGLARMQGAQDKQYHADYAAAQIAKCLGDFAQLAENERAAKEPMPLRPWRVDAAILTEALTTLNADSGKNDFVAQVLKRGNGVLQEIARGKQVTVGDTTWLSTQSDPPSKELFDGSADSVVKSAAPGEAAPEK
jgi:hypothetical protein